MIGASVGITQKAVVTWDYREWLNLSEPVCDVSGLVLGLGLSVAGPLAMPNCFFIFVLRLSRAVRKFVKAFPLFLVFFSFRLLGFQHLRHLVLLTFRTSKALNPKP